MDGRVMAQLAYQVALPDPLLFMVVGVVAEILLMELQAAAVVVEIRRSHLAPLMQVEME